MAQTVPKTAVTNRKEAIDEIHRNFDFGAVLVTIFTLLPYLVWKIIEDTIQTLMKD